MSPIRILFSLAILISLAACGSVDNDPPQLKGNDLGEVSPFDTLKINFDKSVKLIKDTDFSANSAMEILKVKGKTLYVIGKDTVISGLPVLEAGKARHKITISKVEDSDGNVNKKEQTVTFATYPILDSDGMVSGDCLDNGSPKNAEALADSVKFFNGTSFSSELTFAAILDGGFNDDCVDHNDYFKVYLKVGDVLHVKTSGHSVPLSLSFKGPRKKEENTADKDYQLIFTVNGTQKKPALDTSVTIDANTHTYGTGYIGEYLAYYIQISADSEVPVPYLLTVYRD